MRYTTVALLITTLLAGCAGQTVAYGPEESATAPIRGIIHSQGEGDAQVVYAPLGSSPGSYYPVTAKFRWEHAVAVVVQPYPPYLIIDGGGDLIVEPIPGQESRAQAEIDKGWVQIQRAGRVSNAMNAPGSIEAYRTAPRTPEEGGSSTGPSGPFPAPPPPPAPPVDDGLGAPPSDDG